MSAVVGLLSWFKAVPTTEDWPLRRMEGIVEHRLTRSEPTVHVFSRRKKPVAST